ncbi:hypothetical protein MMC28_005436 [Mycoblastus sanguinarius]|nr:hypothetical protein [Mycoblastus sanguinarius]
MPSSPRTPTRRRKSSSVGNDLSFTTASLQSSGYAHKRPSNSRRSSQYSLTSPSTPRPISPYGRSANFGSVEDAGNGLGNLADELAEAFDEDGEDEGEGDVEEDLSAAQKDGAEAIYNRNITQTGHPMLENGLIKGNVISTSPLGQIPSTRSLSPPKQPVRAKHRRKNSQYDGSDYGDDSDLEGADGISPSLEARMAAIESLARRGIESSGKNADDVVKRVAESLKDLGSQSGLENGASRLITAHIALTTHLTHQTRTLLSLAHPFLSPLAAPPDPEFIDDILPLLAPLLTIPKPSLQPLSSIHGLRSSTADLLSTLTYLSDTLHMTRQTTSLASRRLRAAREMVVEMKREADAREEGMRWVEKGDWEERLKGRECARVCGDVVGGFEEVCAGWRERLAGGLGVEVGAA